MLLREVKTLDAQVLRDQKSPKWIGAGVQGVALSTNKTNTVRKVYGLDSFDDPYYRYIKMIEQHQDNPFFPRIYRHSVYKNKAFAPNRLSDYFMTGVVMMEKLQPLAGGRIDKEVVHALFMNLGVDLTKHDLYGTFMNRTNIQKIIDTTTNEQFADALRLLLSSGRHAFDLHAGNWMVRLTSVGPQLVILDPVYGSDLITLPAEGANSANTLTFDHFIMPVV
jgi:hypothetical protein